MNWQVNTSIYDSKDGKKVIHYIDFPNGSHLNNKRGLGSRLSRINNENY